MALFSQTAGEYTFTADGSSTDVDSSGMRYIQKIAFEQRNYRFILIKSPPASGKSRAVMYIALDKLQHQGIEKVIVSVPQKVIGSSFKSVELKGFGTNWEVKPENYLCNDKFYGLVERKKGAVVSRFYQDKEASILVCSHATLINFFKEVDNPHAFDHTLVIVDECHHISVDEGNLLGSVIHAMMNYSTAHIIAMTGSYFRGDRIPILSAEDEDKFEQVIFTYYDQLNGYRFLKKLKLDYAFYEGTWLEGLDTLLNPQHRSNSYTSLTLDDYQNPSASCFDSDFGKPNIDLKTIIYIPCVLSSASTGDKRNEFIRICEILGQAPYENFKIEEQTGFYLIQGHHGRQLKVANLVYEETQNQTLDALSRITSRDDVDIIIALGMAKEGFDWPWCEHVLVAGFRSSLTEMVQIIGRSTRDCEGKTIAKFTNLVKAPEAFLDDAQEAVDDLLKAISLSLMMEQVLQPNIKFVPRSEFTLKPSLQETNTVQYIINDDELSPYTLQLIRNQNVIMDLATHTINHLEQLKPFIFGGMDLCIRNNDPLYAAIITTLKERLPEEGLAPQDFKTIARLVCAQLISISKLQRAKPKFSLHDHPAQLLHENSFHESSCKANSFLPSSAIQHSGKRNPHPLDITHAGQALLDLRGEFIDVHQLDFTLIDHCNPFKDSYEFVSRILDAPVLKKIQEVAIHSRIKVSDEEAVLMWEDVKNFVNTHGRNPELQSIDPYEHRLAEIISYVLSKKQKIS